jgi:hypothetical protein
MDSEKSPHRYPNLLTELHGSTKGHVPRNIADDTIGIDDTGLPEKITLTKLD